MHEGRSLERARTAFGKGNLAGDVVVTLARAQAGLAMTNVDRERLKEALSFLTQAKQGYHWLDSPSLSQDTVACASAFATAARSWGGNQRPAVDFVSDLNSMVNAAQGLVRGDKIDSDDIRLLRNFFHRLLRSAIDDIEGLLSPTRSERSKEWMLLTTTGNSKSTLL